MQQLIDNQSILKIDLVFNHYNNDLGENLKSSSSSELNIDCFEIWEEDIKNWIRYLRSNSVYNPPRIISDNLLFSLGLEFTDDISITKLNSSWRNKACPTDVLSFPVLDNEILYPIDEYVELGDIVVSLQTASKQAFQHNHSLLHELRWLVCHGFLHLLGWEHSNQSSFKHMMFLQEQLLCLTSNPHLEANSKEKSTNE